MHLARKGYGGEVKNVCKFSNAPNVIPSGVKGVLAVVKSRFNVNE